MRTVLQIMSEPYINGYGYSLLRSEYRIQAESQGKYAAAAEWLTAITILFTCPQWWHPKDGDPGIAVHDLYRNGDVLDEDLRLFAEVLRRYIKLSDLRI